MDEMDSMDVMDHMDELGTIADRLREWLAPDRVSTSAGDLDEHSHDESPLEAHCPEIVAWPVSREEVQAVLRLANERSIPVTAWGAGTSLEGNPIPVHGGIVLDFRRMNRIVEIHAADFQVTVDPGVYYKDLNKELGRHGLFFAPDPGANASIGGMLANNAAGIRTVKYGATKDNVLALEVVLVSGEVVKTGSRAVKQSAGYDLTRLFVGSEGTLGIITQATLKLAPIPEHFSAAVADFPTVTAAAETVFGVMASGLEPSAMEVLDGPGIALFNRESGFELPERPTLLMEFTDATEASLAERVAMVESICADNGVGTFKSAMNRDDRARLWEARHRFFEVLVQSHPGYKWILADVAVPISKLPAIVARAQALIDEIPIHGSIMGHAGDGNLHVTFFYPPDDEAAKNCARESNGKLVDEAVRLGGTITGEHGVGLSKQRYMDREHSAESLALMRRIKHLLDPKEILNPGKILPG